MVLSQPTKIIIDHDSPSIVSVMPGQSFELKITILYDQQPEPVIVTSNVVKGDAQVVKERGKSTSGLWLINGTNTVSIALQGTPNQTASMSKDNQKKQKQKHTHKIRGTHPKMPTVPH